MCVLQVTPALSWFWWRRSWWWLICRLKVGPSSRHPTWCRYTVLPSRVLTTSRPSRSNCGRECRRPELIKTRTTPERCAHTKDLTHAYIKVKLGPPKFRNACFVWFVLLHGNFRQSEDAQWFVHVCVYARFFKSFNQVVVIVRLHVTKVLILVLWEGRFVV